MAADQDPPSRDATLPSGYRLRREAPTLEEYVRMRTVAGLSPITAAQAAGPLETSWAWCTVRDGDGCLAAMGRVLGDGGWYFHIADVATDPAHQRRGLGRAVMEDLISRIDDEAPPKPYITLLGDPPGRSLYRSLGFVDSEPSLGMRLPR
ncbi:GNAT family N-acetyltransferase [Brachybacterium sp. p3-SID1565]|uniref:GNAT family N-acetyltransferase n=1 Tax=Brachybacterium epidermidis TaxID=2781983 RepID=A0ABR9W0Q1_9MICO|nr:MULTISPECIES: GNAT family N-acetyltransferase [Brachybacterium]MBE9403020.1 GNAT family N-acetyltransferase [Brachybacterium epidermidis]MCT1385111.1 GNAT family N-acetyltransferase [Brachybacterium sp. p3-SID1565]